MKIKLFKLDGTNETVDVNAIQTEHTILKGGHIATWNDPRPSLEHHVIATCSHCNMPVLIPERDFYSYSFCPRCGSIIDNKKQENTDAI